MSDMTTVRNFQSGRDILTRDAHGVLNFVDQDGVEHHGVSVVCAFPIDAPDEAISIIGHDGHELAWITELADVDEGSRELINKELAQREFTPVIERLQSVSSFATPSTWTVETNRGLTSFVLKGEEDIRRLRDRSLLITDSHGVTYRIANLLALDRWSRKLLDRFL
jgi:hypothetical protein